MIAAWNRLPGNARGAAWVLLAGIFFAFMGVLIKLLGQRLDSFQIAFFRALFGLLLILPLIWGSGLGQLRTRHPVKHLARGVMGGTAMLCGFYAITHLPLANAVAFMFSKPLFLIPMAVVFLAERIRVRRWTATLAGFAGVLIMLRPDAGIETAALVALGGAFLIAGVTVLLKQLSATETPLSILFYFGVISSTLAVLPAVFVWLPPAPTEWFMLVAVGALGATAQACMIRGFRVGEATAMAPFDYVRLIYAGVLGFLVFHEVPDGWTLAGAAVVVGSTLYIARREAIAAPGAAPEAVADPTLDIAARTMPAGGGAAIAVEPRGRD